jgi:hypothetical protein
MKSMSQLSISQAVVSKKTKHSIVETVSSNTGIGSQKTHNIILCVNIEIFENATKTASALTTSAVELSIEEKE